MVSQEATQPATQIVVDPRRLGQQDPDLSPEDLADVCCILHPNSEPARKACCLIRQLTPQHTIANGNTLRSQEPGENDMNHLENKYSYDIALRLSSQLKFPSNGGFYFGRNPKRCDILIGKDASKRISNIHFRIYINEYGYLMLEDLSTNGTAVDGILLRANMKGNGIEYQHVLIHGSIITLAMNLPEGEDDYRFIIRVPSRDSIAEEAYQQNLRKYFLQINLAKNENACKLSSGILHKDPGLDLATSAISKALGRRSKEWNGGPKYNKVNKIGKGAFATVYLITSKYDGVPYAAKELEKRRFMKNGILDPKLDDEMKIMQKIKHPNIVEYIEHINWDAHLYIIMEYVPGGDLGNFISQYGSLQEHNVKMIAVQLLSALRYLHQKGVTHRDIKPDNILISSYSPLEVKLTDFGLSKMIESEETFLRTFCGTLLYCAPEVYSEYREFDQNGRRTLRVADKKSLPPQRYGNAVDVWSLAGVLFYSLCNAPPYPVQNGESYLDLLTRIMGQPLDIRPLQIANTSELGIRFIQSMLHNKPAYRATIEELQNSSWLIEVEKLDTSNKSQIERCKDENVFLHLENSASQLRIQDNKDRVYNSDELNELMKIWDTDSEDLEVSCSFDTSNGLAKLVDTYQFSGKSIQERNNSCLLGKLSSIIGSSDVIPLDSLGPLLSTDQKLKASVAELPGSFRSDKFNPENQIISFQDPVILQDFSILKEPKDNKIECSSLFGAESMVGHLNVCSPISLNTPTSDVIKKPEIWTATASLRRPRDEDSIAVYFDTKRRRGNLQNSLASISKSHWDVKDNPTANPKQISFFSSELQRHWEDYQSSDKNTLHGQDEILKKYAGRKNICSELLPFIQVDSETSNEKGHKNLVEKGNNDTCTSSDDNLHQSNAIPQTAYKNLKEEQKESLKNRPLYLGPIIKNAKNKIVLAKLISSSDSCLPNITISLQDYLTTWGRGSKAIIRYPDVTENRIPKYAFKILLYKEDFYRTSRDYSSNAFSLDDEDPDMKFYISTKASVGIWINDTNLPSHDRQNPNTESKYWGQLKHGDLITVWRHDSKPKQIFTRFRFECYWGKSKKIREPGDQFMLIQNKPYLKDLDITCRKLEDLAFTSR
ncbi:putative protein kinase [Erysiphe necator]|uniref:Autophagy-related protein 1 n=1 Tax=Uncinula necator TaxID=52586 RepID=A0A0B1NZC8_UNCNE|nr:putative protein kinase [Erysiphe necator]